MRRNVNLSELIPMRDRPRFECGLAQILEHGAFDGRIYSRATSSDATDKLAVFAQNYAVRLSEIVRKASRARVLVPT